MYNLKPMTFNLPMTTIGTKIKKVRESKSLTQQHVAARLKMEQGQYSRIENNSLACSDELLMQIAEVLEVEKEDIENFDKQYLFTNNTINVNDNGVFGVNNNNWNDVNYYVIDKRLENLYEAKISLLEEQIAFLKKKLGEA